MFLVNPGGHIFNPIRAMILLVRSSEKEKKNKILPKLVVQNGDVHPMGSNPSVKIIIIANLGLPGRCNMGSYMFLGRPCEPTTWRRCEFL